MARTDPFDIFRRLLIREKAGSNPCEEIPIGTVREEEHKADGTVEVSVLLPGLKNLTIAAQNASQQIQVYQQAAQQLKPLPISGFPILVSGAMPVPNSNWHEFTLNDEQLREKATKMGNRVLRNIEAHETHRIGELAKLIHEKLDLLKAQMSLTNDQWKQYAELTSYINDLIGDPYDPESTDAD